MEALLNRTPDLDVMYQMYTLYTPNLGLAIAVSVRERSRVASKGSLGEQRGAVRKQGEAAME